MRDVLHLGFLICFFDWESKSHGLLLDNLVGHLFSLAKVSHEKRSLLNDISRSFVPLTMESWCEEIIVQSLILEERPHDYSWKENLL
jgi:hypothetical protein